MTHTPDLGRLLAAVDAGDDSCLPILADLLEEQGDARAPAFHGDALGLYLRPSPHPVGWGWKKLESRHNRRRLRWQAPDWLSSSLWRRLRGLCPPAPGCGTVLVYPTRSAAILALAEALAPAR